MKKVFLCIMIALTVCLSVTGCKIIIDGTLDEWRIFRSDNRRSLSDYHIDYLKLSRYSTAYATIYDYNDMIDCKQVVVCVGWSFRRYFA